MALRAGLYVTNDANDIVGPRDARLALSGLLSGPGVLRGGVVSGASSGPSIRYNLAPGVFVCERGDREQDGLYVLSNDAQVTLDSGANAPNSGSRIDLIWVRQKNSYTGDGFGDADSDAEAGVTVGGSGPSPAPPYGSVPAGALVLAESVVSVGDGAGADATITQVADQVGAPTLADLILDSGAVGRDVLQSDSTGAAQTAIGLPSTPFGRSVLAALSRSDFWHANADSEPVADWNLATDIGRFYRGSGAANGPGSSIYSGITVGWGSWLSQIVARTTNSRTVELWQRTYDGSGWSAWAQIHGDTGWVQCIMDSYTSGGHFAVRKINGVVHITGHTSCYIAQGSERRLARLPSGFGPPEDGKGYDYPDGAGGFMSVGVGLDGEISAANYSNLGSDTYEFDASGIAPWPEDD